MENYYYQNLLNTTVLLINKNKNISRIKGEDFNIFSILGVETNENRTHSNFLYELLNPNGNHYLKNTFLHLFIKTIFPEDDFDISTPFRVYKEYSFKDGRIDLMIESKDLLITIENKINARDQLRQMFRYHSYNNSCKHIEKKKLCYLTLDGKAPSEDSTCGLEKDVDYICISYKTHIIEWLKLCIKESAEYPIIRESIKQYIILLKKLTGQLTNQEMNQELIDLITQNPENLEASRYIKDNYDLAVDKLKRQEVELLISQLLKVGFHEEDIDREADDRSDAVFVRIKPYNLDNTIWDLGINIELNNNYYFFCMVERDLRRISNINLDTKFKAIVSELNSSLNNEYPDFNVCGYSVGKSENFTVNIDMNKYYFPNYDNSKAYLEIAQKLFEFKKKLNASED